MSEIQPRTFALLLAVAYLILFAVQVRVLGLGGELRAVVAEALRRLRPRARSTKGNAWRRQPYDG